MATPTMNGSALTAAEGFPAEVREILHAAACGTELTFEQALLLATTEGSALEALVAVADRLRRETVGDAITYVVNRNINFTNVCFVGCSFCGFGRGPGAADAYSLSLDEVVRRAREAWDRGATEVCVQGGLPRDLDGFYYRDLLRAIKHAIPGMHVHAFSPMEIDYGVTKTGMALRDYLQMMKDEGLGSIPGTAAEILDDRVRQELSPNKLPAARWVEIITAAFAAACGVPDELRHAGDFLGGPADATQSSGTLRSGTHLDSSGVFVRGDSHAVFDAAAERIPLLPYGVAGLLGQHSGAWCSTLFQLGPCHEGGPGQRGHPGICASRNLPAHPGRAVALRLWRVVVRV